MTTKEAAARLCLSTIAINKAIERGTLRAVKHGPIWWITEGSLQEYMRDHWCQPGRKARAS